MLGHRNCNCGDLSCTLCTGPIGAGLCPTCQLIHKHDLHKSGGSQMALGINDSDKRYAKEKRPKDARFIFKDGDGKEFWFQEDLSDYAYVGGGHRPSAITEPPRLYKVLKADGTSPMGGDMAWSLPTQDAVTSDWTPGDWATVGGGPIVFCKRGLHAFDGKQYEHWLRGGQRLFEIEFDGPVAKQPDKYIGARARLVREIPSSVIAHAPMLTGKRMTKDSFVLNETVKVMESLRNEFDAYVSTTAIDKATGLGHLQEKAKDAAAKGRIAWRQFTDSIAEAVYSASTIVANYEKVAKVVDVPAATMAAAVEQRETLGKIQAALPTMSWTRFDSPWDGGQVTFREVELVGTEWWRAYSKRADKVILAERKKAEAAYASAITPANFDELVDQTTGAATPRKAAPRKRRGA